MKISPIVSNKIYTGFKHYTMTELTLTGDVGTGVTGFGVISEVPNDEVKEWHQNMTTVLRNHVVHKMVEAIYPKPEPAVLTDKRYLILVQYARKVEGDKYEQANSREEYYLLLADKLYKILKNLQEKRLNRMKDKARAGAHTSLPLVGGNTVMSTAVTLPLQTADFGHGFNDDEHRLRWRDGESNRYVDGFGNAVDVDESANANLNDIYENVEIEE